MNLRNILSVSGVLLALFVASAGSVLAYSFGPPDEKTGAFNESTCTDCHAGNVLNASGGSLMLTIPETYQPNEVYTIVVNLSRAGQSKWGFEMTALDADGASAGLFDADAAGNTQLSETNSKQYIKHTAAGNAAGTEDKHSWEFQWTAPDADMGPITFYAAGNASNNNSNPIDDYIYTTSAESTPPVPVVAGVTLEIVGEKARTTQDAVAGVKYILKVTNTGNMMDTVSLEASAEVGIGGSVLGTLSEREVELEADASTEVTFMVKGDLLTHPGTYPIIVKATSGTDKTMTAEVTVTTTIEMPPPAWDINEDGKINIQDLVLVAGQFGEVGPGLKGDVNGDGQVNILDLVLVASHFGEGTSN